MSESDIGVGVESRVERELYNKYLIIKPINTNCKSTAIRQQLTAFVSRLSFRFISLIIYKMCKSSERSTQRPNRMIRIGIPTKNCTFVTALQLIGNIFGHIYHKYSGFECK